MQTIVDELETSECATSQPKVKATASKDISNGELISTAKHVKYLVTRRHQLGTLLAQIADLKQEVQSKSSKVRRQLSLASFTKCYYRLLSSIIIASCLSDFGPC